MVSASLFTISEELSLEQTIIDSPVHTLWLNIIANHVIRLTFY